MIQRQKLTIIFLIIYWIGFGILAHIPVPEIVYQARVSDKWLHFLAYLGLTFLLWFSIKPQEKVRLGSLPVWIIFLILVIYGGLDELTQPYFGRTRDFGDFLANVIGIAAGLIIFGFLSFWPALLTVWAIMIFGAAVLIKADFSKVAPALDFIFHIFAYAGFTFIWARVIKFYVVSKTVLNNFLVLISLPFGFMLFVKASSMFLGRYFTLMEMAVCTAAISAAAVIMLYSKKAQESFLAKGV